MKTKITSIIMIALSCLSLKAQIPNGGFESWTGLNPNNWITYNSVSPGIVTKNSVAHSGNFAIKLNVVPFSGSSAGGSISYYSVGGNGYFPVSSAPAALHGWYKLSTVTPSEAFFVTSLATSMGTATAVCTGSIQANTSVYTEFIFNYSYFALPSADSASMTISLAQLSSADTLRVGTFAILDDLVFGAAVGVNELRLTHLEPCSPNPATAIANIIYSINGTSRVSLQLYDILGNHVKTLLESLDQNTGRYKIPIDVNDLPGGIYFYRLNVNGQLYSEKLVVTK